MTLYDIFDPSRCLKIELYKVISNIMTYKYIGFIFIFSKLDGIWWSYKHCIYFYHFKLSAPPDCQGVKDSGKSTSGLYVIDPFGGRQRLVTVYCDMETDGGGWTVNIVLSINLNLSFFLSFSLPLALSICPPANPCSFSCFLSFYFFLSLCLSMH